MVGVYVVMSCRCWVHVWRHINILLFLTILVINPNTLKTHTAHSCTRDLYISYVNVTTNHWYVIMFLRTMPHIVAKIKPCMMFGEVLLERGMK